jgi:hypothetical protein
LSLERELQVIEDALVIPLPPKRCCAFEGCGTVLAQSNAGDRCFRHEQQIRRKKVMASFSNADVSPHTF